MYLKFFCGKQCFVTHGWEPPFLSQITIKLQSPAYDKVFTKNNISFPQPNNIISCDSLDEDVKEFPLHRGIVNMIFLYKITYKTCVSKSKSIQKKFVK